MMAVNQSGPARVGIGGPVGSGKTSLTEALIPRLRERGYEVAVVTNDLLTQEDAQRIQRSGLLPAELVIGVEAGACPHTVIREDPTLNIAAANQLERTFPSLDVIIIESGGDNLASTFSLDLVDYWMFVIDVGAGDDIPRKRGPGIVQCDLLVVNKIDIAPYVQANLETLTRDAHEVRGDRPVVLTNCLTGDGVGEVVDHLAHQVLLE
ncbi:MAG: urease accessory protein UreG [Thiotrichales bacterium]|nr:urease accessory protein UreG [Thiotrichales bacterium]